MDRRTALLFDLDGTLVDSVYQHVLAWRVALEAVGIDLSVWRIHRRIGMSGGLFINALLRETEGGITQEQIDRVRFAHAAAYNDLAGEECAHCLAPKALLTTLTEAGVPWAIATSGRWGNRRPRHRLTRDTGRRTGGHAGSGRPRQARPRPVRGRRRAPGREH